MGISKHPDLLEELLWTENETRLLAGERAALTMWLIVESSRRDGLTYEEIKRQARDRISKL